MKPRIVLVAALVLLAPVIAGCATAQETIDLSREMTGRVNWFLAVTDAALRVLHERIGADTSVETIDVEMPDGTKAVVHLSRADALKAIEDLRAMIPGLQDGMRKLDAAIAKGQTVVDVLNTIIALKNPKDIAIKLLPGLLQKYLESVDGEPSEEDQLVKPGASTAPGK